MSNRNSTTALESNNSTNHPIKSRQMTEETWDEEQDERSMHPIHPRALAAATSAFNKLDAELSYRVSECPPELEVLPTKDICSIVSSAPPDNASPSSSSRSFSKADTMYGIPIRDDDKVKRITKSGKKITKQHAQYALTAGMILGIRECVGGDEALREAELEPFEILQGKQLKREWMRIRKYDFEGNKHCITSHYNSKPLPFDYEFKAYAPLIFARIRSAFGVENQSYLHSICGKFNFVEFMSNAKSGQFFFFSHDGQYMIKTMTYEESIFLHEILRHYYNYVMKNPHSFLTRFYGMYRVKMPQQGRSVHFCIMRSVFNTEREIHKTWDLKGSTAGRRAKRGDAVHKDLDILQDGRKLWVGSVRKEAIMKQMRSDATFLARLGIMDYSLLLGVHHCLHVKEEERQAHIDNSVNMVRTTSRPSLMRTNTPFRRHLLEGVEIDAEHAAQAKLNTDMMTAAATDHQSDDDDSAFYDDDSHKGGESNKASASLASFQNNESFVSEEESDASSNYSSDLVGSEKKAAAEPSYMRLDSNPFTKREDLGVESYCDDANKKHTREIYFFGIIDILQQYNARKWGETVIRKAAGSSESEISCVDPETYANRFVKFMSTLME